MQKRVKLEKTTISQQEKIHSAMATCFFHVAFFRCTASSRVFESLPTTVKLCFNDTASTTALSLWTWMKSKMKQSSMVHITHMPRLVCAVSGRPSQIVCRERRYRQQRRTSIRLSMMKMKIAALHIVDAGRPLIPQVLQVNPTQKRQFRQRT